jgi:hypothetical protein
MPIATVKQLCTPSATVKSDSLVEQVAQIEDFATGKIDGREFFRRNHFTVWASFAEFRPSLERGPASWTNFRS